MNIPTFAQLFSGLLLAATAFMAGTYFPEFKLVSPPDPPKEESPETDPPEETPESECPSYEPLKQFVIPEDMFNQLVDEAFYAQYPELSGRSLTCDEGDAEWRSHRSEIEETLLNGLKSLSPDVQQRIGDYGNDYHHEMWDTVKKSSINETDFYSEVWEQFEKLFPWYKRGDLRPEGSRQLHNAVVADAYQKCLQNGCKFN